MFSLVRANTADAVIGIIMLLAYWLRVFCRTRTHVDGRMRSRIYLATKIQIIIETLPFSQK